MILKYCLMENSNVREIGEMVELYFCNRSRIRGNYRNWNQDRNGDRDKDDTVKDTDGTPDIVKY